MYFWEKISFQVSCINAYKLVLKIPNNKTCIKKSQNYFDLILL